MNLVERLHNRATYLDNCSTFVGTGEPEREAAAEIERLRAELAELREIVYAVSYADVLRHCMDKRNELEAFSRQQAAEAAKKP